MDPGFLIGIFIAIFTLTWYYIWKKDVLFGVVYFFLFVYTIFAQIGYVYFPDISVAIKAYFGPEIFYDFNSFITLSFVTFFLCFFFLHRYVIWRPSYKIVQSQPRLGVLFYAIVIFHLISVALYFIVNYDALDYSNASDANFLIQAGVPYILFIVGFKFSVAINLLLYFVYRVRVFNAPGRNRHVLLCFLVLEIILLTIVSIKIGDRTDPLALTIAVTVLEIALDRANRRSIYMRKWKWLRVLLVIAAVIYCLTELEEFRNPGAEVVGRPVAEVVLFKDYYSPFHILIAAMYFDFIDPWKVAVSNAANTLIHLKQPYLQETVADIFNPGSSSRTGSYAFYIFSEGYIFMGQLGFLYNGLVVFFGLAIWRRLANSNNWYYNLFMICLIATQAVNIVRGQSSYFIKDIYMFFIPAMVLFFLATGLRPWFERGRYCKKTPANLEASAVNG